MVDGHLRSVRRQLLHYMGTKGGIMLVQREAQLQRAARIAKTREIKGLPRRQRQTEWVRYVFDTWDVEGSGQLDISEFEMMIKECCIPVAPGSSAKAIFDSIDANGSGEIELVEFSRWCMHT